MDPNPSTISELESELQKSFVVLRELEERGELPRELKSLLALAPPDGASVHVSLRQRDTGRQLRTSGPVQAWTPRACGVWVIYEVAQGLGGIGGPQPRTIEGSGNPLLDFISALDHVEKDPHLHFVSLKWFRDTYLPKRGYDWANDPDLPRQMVHEAAEAEMILTSKVPNPKTPEFPVTTIQLNRTHPKVQRMLESLAPKPAPVPIVPPGTPPAPKAVVAVEPEQDEESAPAPKKAPRKKGSAGEGPREKPVKA
jgi:hypothetical protein